MSANLAQLRDAAQAAEIAFIAFVEACKANGFADEWTAYRSEQNGNALPDPVKAAHQTWMDKLHAFHLARWGEGGVLGGTGA